MRIRSIRPEFWSSEDIKALAWDTRLIFIGLWSYVDDNGVGRDVEKLIVADLFPLEDDPKAVLKKVHGALSELSGRLMLSRYVVDGKPYLHISHFDTHQVINRKSRGRYPLPTCDNADPHYTLTEGDVSTPVNAPTGEGEKGRRGEGEKVRAQRVPDDFTVTDDMAAWAAENTPGLDAKYVTEKFIDYWRAVPGQRGVKLDWLTTWRNWLRRENESGGGSRTSTAAAPVKPRSPWDNKVQHIGSAA